MRLALVDAGDGMEDANFVHDTADKGILRLTKVCLCLSHPKSVSSKVCLIEGASHQGVSVQQIAVSLKTVEQVNV